MKKIVCSAVIPVFIVLCLSGCPDASDDDKSVGEITIYNIPKDIPVFSISGTSPNSAPVFKVYLNASNYMEDDKPPAAKGIAAVSATTLQANNKHTVTIQLLNPNAPGEEDPDLDTGPWSGTANFFSVMICPQDVTEHGVDAVWIQGSTLPLNRGMKQCNWEELINFRDGMKIENDPMQFYEKTLALYTDIILKDNDITK